MVFGDAARVPLVGFVPLHPPAAVHEVAFVEYQVTVEILPDAILVGLAEIVTVGSDALPPEFPAPEPPLAGYVLFDPGNTGTPPGTSTSTMFTFDTAVVSF